MRLPFTLGLRPALLFVAIGSLAALAACGGEDGAAGGGASTTAPPASDPDFTRADVQVRAADIDFPQRRFAAAPGTVVVAYLNEGQIFHTLVLERAGERIEDFPRLEVRTQGDVTNTTIDLAPGEYTLYCDLPGHRANGMEAALVVE